MNLVQRYIFRKLLGAFLVAFPAFSITIWATQALRQLSLVTDRGQGVGVFLEASLLLVPGLVMIVTPVTMLIVVIVTLNSLNGDSELVSLNASGGSPGILVRPILAVAIPVFLLSAASSLYFHPITARETNRLLSEVNANVIASLIRPGQFRSLGRDVVMQVRSIEPGGRLEEIFVFDRHDPTQTIAYLARTASVVDRAEGKFLLMQDGVIQRRATDSNAISVIAFDTYPLDLASLANSSGPDGIRPSERPLPYLLAPALSDPLYQANPFVYAAELHGRLTEPLYVLVLALLPAVFLGAPRSARQGRVLVTTATAAFSAVLVAANLYFGETLEDTPALLLPVYLVPLLGIGLPIAALATGRSPRRPDWLRPPFRRQRAIGAA
ncbi:MAG: LptF/LptG family permease [Bauldia sp.]|nr:LptF/LptG family permease [Bauldia sp.]